MKKRKRRVHSEFGNYKTGAAKKIERKLLRKAKPKAGPVLPGHLSNIVHRPRL